MINEILSFRPYYKSVIWGGERIAPFKGVGYQGDSIGESWEISAVPGHESVVDGGDYDGETLTALCEQLGSELLGENVTSRYGSAFPLLMKYIDARRDLSLQVHPDDELARRRHNTQGKTEMWYVVDAASEARIYCGLSRPLDIEAYKRKVANNTIMEVVKGHKSVPGQFYYIPAGTLHAIGAGNLVAEIQESSDITYRVYDYGRLDADGNPRQLHTAEAAEAIDYTFPSTVEPTGKVFETSTPKAVESRHFIINFLRVDGDCPLPHTTDSFSVVMVTDGEVMVRYDGGELTVERGRTVLIPASLPVSGVSGHGTLLHVTVP